MSKKSVIVLDNECCYGLLVICIQSRNVKKPVLQKNYIKTPYKIHIKYTAK
jgi:hypothetical protein